MSLLALLGLSAAFNFVHHGILLNCLRNRFGITGVVLVWIFSFLTDRTEQVFYGGSLSDTVPLSLEVPQGEVLCPILFLLYTS